MKKFRIRVELKGGFEDLVSLEEEDRDQAEVVIKDAFNSDLVKMDFVDEEDIDQGPEEIDYMDSWHRQKELDLENKGDV